MKLDVRIAMVTGHRGDQLGWEPNPRWGECQAFLRYGLESLIQEGYRRFLSGGAQLVDQWFMQEVIRAKLLQPSLGLELVVAKPVESHGSNWSPHAQLVYKNLCAQADEIVVVSPGPWRAGCEHVRNSWMVRRAMKQLAIWDGSPGGTADAVAKAQAKGIAIVRYNPKTKEVTLIPARD